jgi:ribosomal protein L37AE/L43A
MPRGVLSPLQRAKDTITHQEEVVSMRSLLIRSSQVIRCPACGAYELEMVGQSQARCSRCGLILKGNMLQILLEIRSLPVGVGKHACEECEHPEMVSLPGGVLHCPACRSEVLPPQREEVPL